MSATKRERAPDAESEENKDVKQSKKSTVKEEEEKVFTAQHALKIASFVYSNDLCPYAEQNGYDDYFGEGMEGLIAGQMAFLQSGCACKLLKAQKKVDEPWISDDEDGSESESEVGKDDDESQAAYDMRMCKRREDKKKKRQEEMDLERVNLICPIHSAKNWSIERV